MVIISARGRAQSSGHRSDQDRAAQSRMRYSKAVGQASIEKLNSSNRSIWSETEQTDITKTDPSGVFQHRERAKHSETRCHTWIGCKGYQREEEAIIRVSDHFT